MSIGLVDLSLMSTLAQALHWTEPSELYYRVREVLKPGGMFAVIGYSFTRPDTRQAQVVDAVPAPAPGQAEVLTGAMLDVYRATAKHWSPRRYWLPPGRDLCWGQGPPPQETGGRAVLLYTSPSVGKVNKQAHIF